MPVGAQQKEVKESLAVQTTPQALVIEPIPIEGGDVDDITKLLKIKRWRYHIEMPKPGLVFSYTLELRRPHQEPLYMDGGAFYPKGDIELTFNLMPDDFSSFSTADLLQTLTRMRSPISNTESFTYGGTAKNPMKDITNDLDFYTPKQWFNEDGSITLYDVDTHETETTEKSKLVLVLRASKPD